VDHQPGAVLIDDPVDAEEASVDEDGGLADDERDHEERTDGEPEADRAPGEREARNYDDGEHDGEARAIRRRNAGESDEQGERSDEDGNRHDEIQEAGAAFHGRIRSRLAPPQQQGKGDGQRVLEHTVEQRGRNESAEDPAEGAADCQEEVELGEIPSGRSSTRKSDMGKERRHEEDPEVHEDEAGEREGHQPK
jgi:hypothetical protein